jgi:hypothetical protein
MSSLIKNESCLGLKATLVLKQLKRQADAYKSAVESQNKKMLDLDRRIDQQNEIINQQNARLAEQEEKLAEMSKRVAENENKFTAATAVATVAAASAAVTANSREVVVVDNSSDVVVRGESVLKRDDSVGAKKGVEKGRTSKRTRSDESNKDGEIETKRQKRCALTS